MRYLYHQIGDGAHAYGEIIAAFFEPACRSHTRQSAIKHVVHELSLASPPRYDRETGRLARYHWLASTRPTL